MYLVDTNVLSEASKPAPDADVIEWLAMTPERHLFLSAMTFGEVRKGVELIRRRDPKRANDLERWLANVTAQFYDRIVPVDEPIAEQWGRLEAERPVPFVDGLIAATALVRGWIVATRNVRDFERMGVTTYNPFPD
ncbi:MAG: type II toxin-antitoxin system VapC family toxin [Jatrophihabitans sp.]